MQPLEITDRIREHAERLDAETSPVLFNDLRGPKTVPLTDTDAYSSRPLRGWIVAAASAVAVFLLIGGSIAILNVVAGDSEPEAATVATTTATPSTTAGVTSTTLASQVAPPVAPVLPPETPPTSWTRVDTEMAAESAASGPFGILAIDRSLYPDVVLWSSGDGATWTSSPWAGPVDYSPTSATVDTLTYAGSRYLAFGGHWGIDLRSSVDGVDWIAAEHIDDGNVPAAGRDTGDPTPGTYGQIEQITYGNGVYVAVGDVRDHGDDSYSNPRAAVWTSSDALTWIRLPDNDEVFDGPWHQEMADVAFGSSGFVAVGLSEGDDGMSSVGAIWRSPDGFTWTRIADDVDLFGEQIPDEWRGLWSVTFGDGVYVTIGTGGTILTSDDGLIWSHVPFDDLGEDVALVDIAYGDGSFVVVGNEWSPDEADDGGRVYVPAIWYSTDATDWIRVGDETDLFGGPFSGENGGGSRTVTFGDGRFFVVGYDQVWLDSGESDFNGRVWIGEPAP